MLTKIPATNSNILNLKTIMPVTLQCSVMIAKNDEQVRKAARLHGMVVPAVMAHLYSFLSL